jgi:hypothetical protein
LRCRNSAACCKVRPADSRSEEFRTALAEVSETFDVDRLNRVVRRWWPRAVLDANPDPITEHIGQRLGDGDESVLTKTAVELRAEMVSQGESATR